MRSYITFAVVVFLFCIGGTAHGQQLQLPFNGTLLQLPFNGTLLQLPLNGTLLQLPLNSTLLGNLSAQELTSMLADMMQSAVNGALNGSQFMDTIQATLRETITGNLARQTNNLFNGQNNATQEMLKQARQALTGTNAVSLACDAAWNPVAYTNELYTKALQNNYLAATVLGGAPLFALQTALNALPQDVKAYMDQQCGGFLPEDKSYEAFFTRVLGDGPVATTLAQPLKALDALANENLQQRQGGGNGPFSSITNVVGDLANTTQAGLATLMNNPVMQALFPWPFSATATFPGTTIPMSTGIPSGQQLANQLYQMATNSPMITAMTGLRRLNTTSGPFNATRLLRGTQLEEFGNWLVESSKAIAAGDPVPIPTPSTFANGAMLRNMLSSSSALFKSQQMAGSSKKPAPVPTA